MKRVILAFVVILSWYTSLAYVIGAPSSEWKEAWQVEGIRAIRRHSFRILRLSCSPAKCEETSVGIRIPDLSAEMVLNVTWNSWPLDEEYPTKYTLSPFAVTVAAVYMPETMTLRIVHAWPPSGSTIEVVGIINSAFLTSTKRVFTTGLDALTVQMEIANSNGETETVEFLIVPRDDNGRLLGRWRPKSAD